MNKYEISLFNRFIKRSFDILLSFLGLIITFPIILVAFIIAAIDTRENGFFVQTRMGKNEKVFNILKIKTMKSSNDTKGHVTTLKDKRITKSGKFFRKYKIDELPQLVNVLKGDMSFVGPRPDIPEIYINLNEEEKVILKIRPGITGPATIKYKNEEEILAKKENPVEYNRNVIFKDKIKINRDYIKNYSFSKDLGYIFKTIF